MKFLYEARAEVLITLRLLKVVAVLLSGLLVACATVTGPVDIREAEHVTGVGHKARVHSAGKSSSVSVMPQGMAVVRPVYPTASAESPLKARLLRQSEEQLAQKKWANAIESAERGLRIDRKEPLFYDVLAVAYSESGNRTQSVLFARQGLLYATKGTRAYTSLKQLSQ